MSKEYEDAIQKTVEAMTNKMNSQIDVYLMADLKRMSDKGVLEIQQGQPKYTPILENDIYSVKCELPIRLYFKGEETINNLQSKLSELERENKQLHEDKKFYSEQWEKVSKENENIIEDIKYIIEHCANGTEYVYDELNKIITNNTNK